MNSVDINRCNNCRKKTLFFSTCKCNNNYCLKCLPYFNHNCLYDWNSNKKKDLTKENPQIIGKKVETI